LSIAWSNSPWSAAQSVSGVEPFHLFRYLDERMLAFNLRDLDDLGRFQAVMSTVSGRRVTYAELTGQS
jgi:hypothetical protein